MPQIRPTIIYEHFWFFQIITIMLKADNFPPKYRYLACLVFLLCY